VNSRLHSPRPVPQASSPRPYPLSRSAHSVISVLNPFNFRLSTFVSLGPIPFVFKFLRTLFRNEALATPFVSIASALFSIQRGVYVLPPQPESSQASEARAVRQKRGRGEKGTGARGAPIPVVGPYMKIKLAQSRALASHPGEGCVNCV
jgi:hypothetical protein